MNLKIKDCIWTILHPYLAFQQSKLMEKFIYYNEQYKDHYKKYRNYTYRKSKIYRNLLIKKKDARICYLTAKHKPSDQIKDQLVFFINKMNYLGNSYKKFKSDLYEHDEIIQQLNCIDSESNNYALIYMYDFNDITRPFDSLTKKDKDSFFIDAIITTMTLSKLLNKKMFNINLLLQLYCEAYGKIEMLSEYILKAIIKNDTELYNALIAIQ